MADLTVRASKRFLRTYDRAVALRGLAEGEVRNLLRRRLSNPQTWSHDYQHVHGPQQARMEADLGGCSLLLTHAGMESITLLHMRGHSIVQHSSQDMLRKDLRNSEPAPDQFLPGGGSGFFPSEPNLS